MLAFGLKLNISGTLVYIFLALLSIERKSWAGTKSDTQF
jgi:hypothetical protein